MGGIMGWRLGGWFLGRVRLSRGLFGRGEVMGMSGEVIMGWMDDETGFILRGYFSGSTTYQEIMAVES